MFPMGMVTPRMTAARWRSKRFTSSTTFVVPPDVGLLWFDACAGGGGGGGGYDGEGGGGGGGGTAAPAFCQVPFPVVPGETLTLTVGAGGAGGAKGSNGTEGGYTSLTGLLRYFVAHRGVSGGNGTVAAGGAGGNFPNAASGNYIGPSAPGGYGWPFFEHSLVVTTGSAGGAPSSNGLGLQLVMPPPNLYGGGTGNATGGGGGAGGISFFAYEPALGGNGGSAGADATGYGGGGAGGGGNAAGGAGSNGMILLCMLTAYEI